MRSLGGAVGHEEVPAERRRCAAEPDQCGAARLALGAPAAKASKSHGAESRLTSVGPQARRVAAEVLVARTEGGGSTSARTTPIGGIVARRESRAGRKVCRFVGRSRGTYPPAAVDQLDAIAVGILDEADERAAFAHPVGLALRLDALLL